MRKTLWDVSEEKRIEYECERNKQGTGEVHKRCEAALVEHGITRLPYHGGALTGMHVQVLFQKADEIFGNFLTIILNDLNELRQSTAEEARDMVERYVELSTLLDGLFALSRTPSGELTEEISNEAKRYVKVVMVKWRDLRLSTVMPKVHTLEDHLINQMQQWNGIGCFMEDFVEQAHQFGIQEESRTRGMWDRARAAYVHSVWEYTLNRSEVQVVKQEMKTRNKRKQKFQQASAKESNKRARAARQRQCLAQATLTPNLINEYTR